MPGRNASENQKGEPAIDRGRSSVQSTRCPQRRRRNAGGDPRAQPCRERGLSGSLLRAVHADPEVMLYAARVSVWLRWAAWAVALAQLAHRPEFWFDTHREYLLLHVPAGGAEPASFTTGCAGAGR